MPLYTITGDHNGLTLSEIKTEIMFNLGHVVNGVASYSRVPETRVLAAINKWQRFVAEKTHCIRKIAILNTTADKGWYKCPENMVPSGITAAFHYPTSTGSETFLDLYDRDRLDYEYPGWRTADSGTPMIIVPAQMYGNCFTIEVYPKPDTGGSWTTQPTGVYLGSSPSLTTPITGLATGGSTTTLIDTGTTFTALGLTAGMVVWNVTDSGYGYILSVATNTITLAAAMTNGADFTGGGDSYEILTDFAGVVTDWTNSDQYIFMSELGEVSDFQPNANNILLEYAAYPINMSVDTDYPQIPRGVLQDILVDLATGDIARKGHERTKQMESSERYFAEGMNRLSGYIGSMEGSPYKNMPRRMTVVQKRRGR